MTKIINILVLMYLVKNIQCISHIVYKRQTSQQLNKTLIMRKCDEEESIFLIKEAISNNFLVYELFTDLKCIIGTELHFPNQ